VEGPVNVSETRIGGTDVGRLAFGCWRMTNPDVGFNADLVELAVESGMNLIDQADVYGFADQLEIGGLVYERSILPTDCEGGYTLRPTSLHVLDAALRASLRAAPSRDTPAPTASAPEGS